ncbi:MAG: hypothetical protein AABY22_09055, partial [Nanoarchaeota archaeon]
EGARVGVFELAEKDIVEMRKSGSSYAVIAKKMGLSCPTVRRICLKYLEPIRYEFEKKRFREWSKVNYIQDPNEKKMSSRKHFAKKYLLQREEMKAYYLPRAIGYFYKNKEAIRKKAREAYIPTGKQIKNAIRDNMGRFLKFI